MIEELSQGGAGGPASTDELTVRAARNRRDQPYLAVTDDEGNELAAVLVEVTETGAIAIKFDQYRDCPARFEIVTLASHSGYPNEVVWRS